MTRTSVTATQHDLDDDYVRDQLVPRAVELNGKRHNPEGEYVLYWMQSTHRLDENWSLRAAIRAADRVARPLVVHQGLDPTYPYASARHHTFILEGARDTARRAKELGLHYHFVLRERRNDDRRVVDRLAARAYLVITDLFPTAGVRERSLRFAERASCRVLAIDSSCAVPSGLFAKAEFAARTIRPKLGKLLDHAIEPITDHTPRVTLSGALQSSVRELLQADPLEVANLDDTAIGAAVARCEIDHSVTPVQSLQGGSVAARERLTQFVGAGLFTYDERRAEAADDDSSSKLSPYLHFGHIASAEVVRAARESGASPGDIEAFIQQVTTWRELSFNWCVRTPNFDSLDALPDWVRRTMAQHVNDVRPQLYDLAALENAQTHDELWNAAQRELRESGVIHNYPRMLWGKTLLLWTPDYETARAWMYHLNDKWALDGRDPNSVGGIMWCLGLWDRPWGNRDVWGGIRPMVTSRAKLKFDVGRYVAKWAARR